MSKHDGPAKERSLDFESDGLDDADDEIIDLLEVVKPGKQTASDAEDVDFSKDLESMLDSLSEAEKAKAASFPDPTPVDHAVDHNESLDMPGMDDLDELLQSLGADSPQKAGADADLPADDEKDIPDLDAAPLAGKGKGADSDDDDFDALLGALDLKPARQTAEAEIDAILPVDDILGDLDKMDAGQPAAPSIDIPDDSASEDSADAASGKSPATKADAGVQAAPDDDFDSELEAILGPARTGKADELSAADPGAEPGDLDADFDEALDEEAALSQLDKAPAAQSRPADPDLLADLADLDGLDAPDSPEALDAPDGNEAEHADEAQAQPAEGSQDSPGSPDALGALSISDILDSSDISDSYLDNDAPDVMDVTDAADVTDAPDVTDVMDAPDTTDTPDITDIADAPTPPEAPDVADLPDSPQAPDEDHLDTALGDIASEGLDSGADDEAAQAGPAPVSPASPPLSGPRSGTGLDEVDLVELDALLDDMLAGAPASGPGFAESAPSPSPVEAAPSAPLAGPGAGLTGAGLVLEEEPEKAAGPAPGMQAAMEEMRGELDGLRRDLNEALAMLSEAAAERGQSAGPSSEDLAARLEDLELTLAARTQHDEAREKTLLLHSDQLGLFDGRLEVLEEVREQMTEAAGRISALEQRGAPPEGLEARLNEMEDRMRLMEERIESMAASLADLDKLAAEAAARVIREELAALLTENIKE